MGTISVPDLLKFATLQMAAEANYPIGFASGGLPLPTLLAGNGRSSIFPLKAAEKFLADGWSVISHIETPTGFSGTAFINGNTQGVVISFRSTEFVDDSARDSKATNELEIRKLGWALGQIADMKAWFEELDRDPAKLQGKQFSITGYSLGGHLASAFNKLMVEAGDSQAQRIAATYTFNGAGVGDVRGTTLTDVIRKFDETRLPLANADLFADQKVQTLYIGLVNALAGAAVTGVTYGDAKRRVRSAITEAASLPSDFAGRATRLVELAVLQQALDRAADVFDEVKRVKDGIPSGSASAPAFAVEVSDVAALRLDYQLSILRVAGSIAPFRTGVFESIADAVAIGRQTTPLSNAPPIYDVYGSAPPSAVANSQHHYGTPIPVFIEEQPITRGNVAGAIADHLYNGLNLLQPGFAENDFGDTHSLVLLVDSLATQDALVGLGEPKDLFAILEGASNASVGVGHADGQGYADGDTLEKVLKGIADALRVTSSGAWRPLAPSLRGNTWFEIKDKGPSTGRDRFYENLQALTTSTAYIDLRGQLTLNSYEGNLDTQARTDFGALISLLTLSPVVIHGASTVFDATMERVWGQTYKDWQRDKMLPASDRDGLLTFSDAYLRDRNALLRALNLQNLRNTNTSTVIDFDVPQGRAFEFNYYQTTRLDKTAPPLERLIAEAGVPSRRPPEMIFFGSDAGESIGGYSNLIGDHLYGGGGDDTIDGAGGPDLIQGDAGKDSLIGGEQDDTLIGGSGADVLLGGPGADWMSGGQDGDVLDGGSEGDTLRGDDGTDILNGGTGADFLYGGADRDGYYFDANWGHDTIEDSDGSGSITVAGFGPLSGAGAKRVGDSEWVSASGKIHYTVIGADNGTQLDIRFDGADDSSIRVRKWANGQLDITLDGAVTTPPTVDSYVGDFAKADVDGTFDIRQGNYVAAGDSPGAQDEITGGADADLLQGLLGNDALAGMQGNDRLEGGSGDDLLLGGSGADSLYGGDGHDIIFGSGVGGLQLPRTTSEPPISAAGPEMTRGFGWVTFDSGIDGNGVQTWKVAGADARTWLDDDGSVIDGGTGNDTICAGSGDDLVHGGEDEDSISGQDGDDTLYGDAGNDRIEGDGIALPGYITSVDGAVQGDDLLFGGIGDDTLIGQGGEDELYGGANDDLLLGDASDEKSTPFVDHGDDYLEGGEGNDKLIGGGRDDILYGGSGKDTLFGDASLDQLAGRWHGNDFLDGGQGDDDLEGGGADDTLYGGADNDMLWGDASASGLTADQYGNDLLEGEIGNDTLVGGAKDDTLFGGAGNDVLTGDANGNESDAGDAGNDELDGGAGNDMLRGGGRDDTLRGGEGDDLLEGDGGGADVIEGEDFIEAGAGNDTLNGNGAADYLDGGDGDDNLFGGAGSDYLEGGAGHDFLDGGAGDDTLVGGAGTDILRGGAGNDTYRFSAGDSPLHPQGWSEAIVDREGRNTIVFDDLVLSADVRVNTFDDGTLQIVVSDGQSIAIQNGASGSIAAFQFGDGKTLTFAELIGTFADTPASDTGADGVRHVHGGRRNDTLTASGGGTVSGGRGSDTLLGSGGSNTYGYGRHDGPDLLIDHGGKTEAGGNPTPNRVVFGSGIAASDLRLSGAAGALRIQVGDDPDDSITLGEFDHTVATDLSPIDELVFDDGSSLTFAELVARGFEANDGGDTVVGSAGDDRVSGGGGNDSLVGDEGADTLSGAAGFDVLDGGEGGDRYVFGAGDDIDILVDKGSAQDVDSLVLTGVDPANVVVMRHGQDLSVFLQGSFDAVLVEGFFDGQGIETISYDDGSSWDRADIEERLATPPATEDGDDITLSDRADSFDSLDGDDVVRGLAGVDTLAGGPGNDTLFGGAGDDELSGGDGRDSLAGDQGNDALAGDEGDDSLCGGDGDDTLVGGIGDDELRGGDGSDVFWFARGDGHDKVSTGDTSTSKVDALVFAPGIAPTDVVVRRLGDDVVIDVGAGDSLRIASFLSLEGESPARIEEIRFFDGTVWTWQHVRDLADTTAGTSGADRLIGSDRADRIDAGGGNDTVFGLGGADTLLGSGGEDWLDGGAGDDRLEGGTGIDTLVGGAGSDTFIDGERMFDDAGDDTYVAGSAGIIVQIDDGQGDDTLVLPAASRPSTTRVDVGSNSGIGSIDYLDLRTAGGTILVSRFFASPDSASKIEHIRFGDGTSWSVADVLAHLPVNNLSDAADEVAGFRWNDDLRSLGGNDIVRGGDGDDTIDGGDGHDRLYGDVGNDSLLGSTGNDTAYGHEGDDVLVGGDGDDSLYGDQGAGGWWTPYVDGADVLVGGIGNDYLEGEGGDDTLEGGPGSDTMSGGAGADTYRIGRTSGRDRIVDLWADDRIAFDADVEPDDVTLHRDGAALIVAIGQTQAQARVLGHGGSDYRFEFASGAVWSAADIAARTIGGIAEAMTGTAGDDTFIVDDPGDTIGEDASAGNDTVISSVSYVLPSNVENLRLEGYVDLDATGNALDNRLTGNLGNNVIDARQGGRDTLVGGAGDDLYYTSLDTAAIVEESGDGIDTAVSADFDYMLPANVENLRVRSMFGGYVLPVRLVGNDLDNLIVARTSNSPGAFTAVTNDTVDGGVGADTMVSGAVEDTFYVDNPGDVIVAETANVFSTIDWTLGAGHRKLTLIGASETRGVGNVLDNWLDASTSAAANTLVGGTGNDLYRLGAGDRVVEFAGEGDDTVVFNYRPALGSIEVDSVGSASIEHYSIDAQLRAGIWINGSERGDEIEYSSAGPDQFLIGRAGGTVQGRAGDDTLRGNVGNDRLGGDDGADVLEGDAGLDTLIGGVGDDQLNGGADNDIYLFAVGDGRDVISEASYAGADKRNVIRFDASVSSDDVAVGRVADDLILSIGVGQDEITIRSFFAGNDPTTPTNPVQRVEFADGSAWNLGVLRAKANPGLPNAAPLLAIPLPDVSRNSGDVSEVVIARGSFVDSDSGDMLTYSATLGDGSRLPSWLSFDPETTTFRTQAPPASMTATVRVTATDGYGLAASDTFDLRMTVGRVLGGSMGDDSLIGGAGDDTLYGLGGYDFLDGGAGMDSMLGGTESDRYVVDDSGDVVVEHVGEGFDTIESSVSYRLPANVERLFLRGEQPLTGIGNDDANTLWGNAGNNRLDGGLGADEYGSGGGDDTFVVDNPGDVVPQGPSGLGTVESSVSYTLPYGLRSLVLTGTAPLNGTGNSDANILRGNAGDNRLVGGSGADALSGDAGDDTLDGGWGADSMTGGTGNDTYVVDDPGDVVVELAGEGIDWVEASATITLAAEVENLRLTASASASGVGNALGNLLIGDATSNGLRGMGGDDTLDGGAGNDFLEGGAGNDTYRFGRGAGADTIGSFDDAPGKTDTIALASGIVGSDIDLARLGNNLRISFRSGSTDTLVVQNHFSAIPYQIDRISFADGTVWDAAAIQSLARVNRAPTLVTPLPDQTFSQGSPFSFSFAASAFTDPDGDALTYSAFNLPSWVAFNPTTRTFTGTSPAQAGTRTVQVMASDTSGLAAADWFDLTIVGAGRVIYGTPNADALTADANDTVYAGGGDDSLYAKPAPGSVLYGEAGNDYFLSQGGSASLIGGAGNDGYVVDTATDVIVERVGEGTDWVRSSVDFVLPAEVENLSLIGSAKSGTGNALANRIDTPTDSYVGHTLDGGAGVDWLQGAYGNDTYIVDDPSDVVYEFSTSASPNSSVDTIRSSVTYSLPYNVENLVLTGRADINAYGGGGNERITGNGGANLLTGNMGNDTLDGGAGNDSLDAGSGNDIYRFGRGYGADTINSFDWTMGTPPYIDTLQLVDLLPGDITLQQVASIAGTAADDLLITVKGAADSMRVVHHFLGGASTAYRIDTLQFADGSSWDSGTIGSRLSPNGLVGGDRNAVAAAALTDRAPPVSGRTVSTTGRDKLRFGVLPWEPFEADVVEPAADPALLSPAFASSAVDDRMTIGSRAQQLVDAEAWFSAAAGEAAMASASHPFHIQPILSASLAP